MVERYAMLIIVLGLSAVANGKLTPGSHSFEWDDTSGSSAPDRPLEVYYYRPTTVTADTPVWIIMHGKNRNADDYRDYFVTAAKQQGAIVIAPRFSRGDWPGSRSYNLGNVSISESNLKPRARTDWSFSKIEPLFDHLIKVLEPSLQASGYCMFGHSAGAQFTHRFLTWIPEARVEVAVVANAGWYTMPRLNDNRDLHAWPYSLVRIPDFDSTTDGHDALPLGNLEQLLKRRLVVLLGALDQERTSSMRQTPEADAQGRHRLARGQRYFAEARAVAVSRGLAFGWEMRIVQGVGHSGSQMAIPAAKLFRSAKAAGGPN